MLFKYEHTWMQGHVARCIAQGNAIACCKQQQTTEPEIYLDNVFLAATSFQQNVIQEFQDLDI